MNRISDISFLLSYNQFAVHTIKAIYPGSFDPVTNGHLDLIARGADPKKVLAEIMTRSGGYAGGKAGTLHGNAPDLNFPLSSGIVAGILPISTGTAFALAAGGIGALAAPEALRALHGLAAHPHSLFAVLALPGLAAAALARPPAEGDQAIIEERRYRVRSARWADTGRLVWEIEAVPC